MSQHSETSEPLQPQDAAVSAPPQEPLKERNWKRGVDELKETFIDKPALWLEEVLAKSQNLARTNFELAVKFAGEGKHEDAIRRFKFTLWLDKNYHACHYHMGMCYAALEKTPDAISELKKALQYEPDRADVLFMLASLDPGSIPADKIPGTMPPALAQTYFDQLALIYDEVERGHQYKGHMITAQYVQRFIEASRNDYRLLDCGCGTGLVGRVLHSKMDYITGIDISSRMVEQARQAKAEDESSVYNELFHTDIRDYCRVVNAPQFHFITLARSPAYIGELNSLMPALHKNLYSGGILVILHESYDATDSYGFSPKTGRYGHGEGYIRAGAEAAGFQVVAQDSVPIYADMTGKIAVLKKA